MPLSGRALLIEDNAIVALDAEDMLRAIGFSAVDVAPSVARAMDLLRTQNYSGALLDLMVKDGSSVPVAEALVRTGVPFVIASGYNAGPTSPALAAAPRITKPYDEHTLSEAMREAYERGKARKR